MNSKHLTPSDFERFELMARNGSDTMAIFTHAINEGFTKYEGILLLRRIFDLNLMQCADIVQRFDERAKQ